MKYYVGLDVAMKNTSVCIVDKEGKIVHESSVKTDPNSLADAIEKTGLETVHKPKNLVCYLAHIDEREHEYREKISLRPFR